VFSEVMALQRVDFRVRQVNVCAPRSLPHRLGWQLSKALREGPSGPPGLHRSSSYASCCGSGSQSLRDDQCFGNVVMQSVLYIRRPELLAEDAESELDDEEEDAAARRESKHFGEEARVEGAEALLASDEQQRRERPAVLGRLTGHLRDPDEASARSSARSARPKGSRHGRLTLIEFCTRDLTTSTRCCG